MTKILIKNVKLKFKDRVKKVLAFFTLIDIDWIFIFLASFVMLQYDLLTRVLFSIGLSYVYKMVFKDMIKISVMRNKK